MAITKAQARTVIRSLLDDEAKRQWQDAALDVLTQTVIDELWGEILDFAPWYASQLDSVVSGSDGLVDLTSAGPLTKRFFKIQKVTRDSQEYFTTHPRDFAMMSGLQVSAPDRSYFPMGGKMYGFPLESGCTYEIRYNFLPTAYTSISDNTNVSWVDGFDAAYIFETAARASIRSDANILSLYQTTSRTAMERLYGKIKREYVGAATIKNQDDPVDFGGI